jgi:hypothetical protein
MAELIAAFIGAGVAVATAGVQVAHWIWHRGYAAGRAHATDEAEREALRKLLEGGTKR